MFEKEECLADYRSLLAKLEEDAHFISNSFNEEVLDKYRQIMDNEIARVKEQNTLIQRL